MGGRDQKEGGRLFEFEFEVGWGWTLIRGWALIKFSAFRMDVYSRWALILGWALIRINTASAAFISSFER